MASQPRSTALIRALVVGTILQLVMVLSGHSASSIAAMFAVAGMAISLVAGFLYAWWAGRGLRDAALYGAIAGGGCALVGIFVSYLLGDVTASILLFGTLSSAVTGLVGGLVGRAFSRRTANASL